MSDAKISDEGCRRCDRLEDQLEVAEKQVKALRAQLRESGEYRDGLAAKVIELEGRLSEDRGNEWDEWLRERQDATGAFNPAKR
jgi:septal ring factor EnvC (AmiA/AmiB activator)